MKQIGAFPLYQVDAFTDRPFAGNPAAVCIVDRPMPEDWMQDVAAEMNLAETAYLLPADDGFDLRWFTPTVEVDLCGHATLAAAHVLWETERLALADTARFHTRSGLLTATRVDGAWLPPVTPPTRDSSPGAESGAANSRIAIELDFPAEPEHAAEPPMALRDALDADLLYTGKNRFDILVEVADAHKLRNLRPDFRRLAEIPARGIIVTCPSDRPDCDFLSRFFAPASGIDEDPVTGTAHCCLGPFWQRRLNRSQLIGCQVSRRGGVVGVRMAGDRVMLTGQAVTVLKGQLT